MLPYDDEDFQKKDDFLSDVPINIHDEDESNMIVDEDTLVMSGNNDALESKRLEEKAKFYRNLAHDIDEEDLKNWAHELLEKIEEDVSSRKPFDDMYIKGMEQCGIATLTEENLKGAFEKSKGGKFYDSTLMEAMLSFYSTVMGELFNEKELVTTNIKTVKNDYFENLAEQKKDFFNAYLTEIDKEYYQDSGKMVLELSGSGSVYKKVDNIDPVTGNISPRFVKAYDLILNADAKSLDRAERITERADFSKSDIVRFEEDGYFLVDEDLSSDKAQELETKIEQTISAIDGIVDVSDKCSEFPYYISYVITKKEFLEKFEKNVKNSKLNDYLPYRIYISRTTKKIVAVYRDWGMKDEQCKRKKRFVHYYYFPGFGINGIGLFQLLTTSCEAVSNLVRQLIMSAEFANYPGGMYTGNPKSLTKTFKPNPGEWIPLDSPEMDASKAMQPWPYKDASPTLLSLVTDVLMAQEKRLTFIADPKIYEDMQNAPVGTTLALLEKVNKLVSPVLRSFYNSFREELSLLNNLFRENFLDNGNFSFYANNKLQKVNREIFTDLIEVVPTCNPYLESNTQKMIRNDAVYKIAMENPNLHNMREVLKSYYTSIGVSNIDVILPEDKEIAPLDPVTENTNILNGKPVKASLWQDHEAHIQVHSQLGDNFPDLMQQILAHIREHEAMKYLAEMQAKMGISMPQTEEELLNPEVQNEIAVRAAEVAIKEREKLEQQNPPPMDPTMAILADVEQKKEAAKLKHQEAEMKTETEVYKATMEFESEKEKRELEREISEEKNETNLKIAKMKHDEAIKKNNDLLKKAKKSKSE